MRAIVNLFLCKTKERSLRTMVTIVWAKFFRKIATVSKATSYELKGIGKIPRLLLMFSFYRFASTTRTVSCVYGKNIRCVCMYMHSQIRSIYFVICYLYHRPISTINVYTYISNFSFQFEIRLYRETRNLRVILLRNYYIIAMNNNSMKLFYMSQVKERIEENEF